MTLPQSDTADQRFAASLLNLESGEPPRRRQAMAFLEQLGGLRAFQVAASLTGDSDQVVAAAARRICGESVKKGLILRGQQQAQPLAQTFAITNFYQLLDEVVFILRRNLSGVVIDSFLFSIPKFAMVTLIFLCFYFSFLVELFRSPWGVCPLLFFYELLWRPLVWNSTGVAFLSGFPENSMRRQAVRVSRTAAYWDMVWDGLLEGMLYASVLSALYCWYLGVVLSLWPAAMLFVVWLMVWVGSSCTAATRIMLRNPDAKVIWRSGYIGNFWLALKLGAVLACLYLVVVGSSLSLFWMLGFADVLDWPGLFFFGFLIAADALIDPFVIGFRILLARLNMESGSL